MKILEIVSDEIHTSEPMGVFLIEQKICIYILGMKTFSFLKKRNITNKAIELVK